MRRPRRRDPHRPRHGLEVLPAQQTHHYLTLAPGREPTPTAAPGGHAGRHRFLNVLPHLDTPPARTLSQSSVQENPRAQEPAAVDAINRRYGRTLIGYGQCGEPGGYVGANIAYGRIPELEDFQ